MAGKLSWARGVALVLVTALCNLLGAVVTNWAWAFAGNYVGGGLLMGGAYAWLNKTSTSYRD